MRATSGFITNDGTFYERDVDAQLHDNEMNIRGLCVTHNVDAEKLITIIEALADPIMEYVHAFKAKIKTDVEEITSSIGQNNKDDESAEGPTPAVLE